MSKFATFDLRPHTLIRQQENAHAFVTPLADNVGLMKTAEQTVELLATAPHTPPATNKVRWKPNVTVAALIERDGKFLLVEEDTSDGILLNNPAGHLDPGESPVQAVIRETLEETACQFQPDGFVGMFMSRFRRTRNGEDTTYLRLAFHGTVSEADPTLELDEGILRTVWLSIDEIRSQPHRMRSPLVIECIEAYLAGQSYPLSILNIHDSVFSTPVAAKRL